MQSDFHHFSTHIKNLASGLVDFAVDVGAVSALGFVSGHLLNHVVQVLTPTSFFSKIPFLNPLSGSICCGVFIIVDFIVKSIFQAILGPEKASEAKIVILRVVICIPIAAVLTNFEGFLITFAAAFAVIITALVGYAIIQEVARRI